MRIVFMGTPEFAVPSLELLCESGYSPVAVITAPDKPAGRGMQLQSSPVKKGALRQRLNVLQPLKLKSPEFIDTFKSLEADLAIVVAFRMLPEVIWSTPSKGTFNLHASLLPQYRGAAPINWALINGETATGLTTFFLQQEIDTGKILFQEKIPITENMNAGELHDIMMAKGARLILKTVQAIESGNIDPRAQEHSEFLKTAPKIFKETGLIDWNKNVENIYNLIRGLSPYPGAYTFLHGKMLKIFRAEKEFSEDISETGKFISDQKTFIKIKAADGFIQLKELQLEGKKIMTVEEFLRGHARLLASS